MIVLGAESIEICGATNEPLPVKFACRRTEDVFNALSTTRNQHYVQGSITHVAGLEAVDPDALGTQGDQVRVAVCRVSQGWAAKAFVVRDGSWVESEIQVIPVKDDLFSRTAGLMESDAISDRRAFLAGLGSGGTPIAIELVKSGLMNLYVMDDDRIEIANVVRHGAGLSDVGRYKTHYITEAIQEKNPYANVYAWEKRVTWKNIEFIREIVRSTDLVICAIDERQGRQVLNRLCVEENKPCIFAAAFRRAYGGQILVLEPGKTPCYECFLRLLPEQANDQEISSARSASAIAYSDRPVAVEPGLSIDIAPISQMAAKLALQILLRGRPSTFRSLDEDLSASWYLWLNRREQGTDYESLKPLGCDIDGMHVLRWYGIEVERIPECPVCGDFTGHLAKTASVSLSPADIEKFAPDGSGGE